MNKLILFDIDKTLISSSKAHNKAFSEAFKKVYGTDTNIDIINHHGMTDQQIIIDVLKKNGLDEKMIKSKITECMEMMADSFDEFIGKEDIIPLDGVQELLKKLSDDGFLLGLVTGNLEHIAKGKLEKTGIGQYFKVGGFGSDDISRKNLVRLAIKRAEENFAFRFNDNVFLLGDAPQDMKAGKGGGAKTIGVTTGIYSKKQLKDASADFVVPNLKNKEEILKIILK